MKLAIRSARYLVHPRRLLRLSISRASTTTMVALMALAGAVQPAVAAAAEDNMIHWTTLGTNGGPVANPERSEPANLLRSGDRVWMIDCGDGAVERLSAVGLQPSKVSKVFISHLHLDHIGGLQGLIGLRWMQVSPGVLTVYGPPGIEAVVAGIVDSLRPSAAIGLSGKSQRDPAESVKAVVIKDGADLPIDGVRLRAVRNSHFDTAPGKPEDNGTQSLSMRFDVDGRSVTYTGDTGPSDAVVALARNSDLLVSEVIDMVSVEANLRSPANPMPKEVVPALLIHLREQHLTPRAAAEMAARAGVGRLVFTHLGMAAPFADVAPIMEAQAREVFRGPVHVAKDLEQF